MILVNGCVPVYLTVCLCVFLLDAAVVRRLHGDVSGVVMVTDVLIALRHVGLLIPSSLRKT